MSPSKIPGVVTAIEGSSWWARLIMDGAEYEAKMNAPLPDDVKVGSYFTIHRPNHGDPYLYWIRGPMITKRQIKSARKRARELLKLIKEQAS